MNLCCQDQMFSTYVLPFMLFFLLEMCLQLTGQISISMAVSSPPGNPKKQRDKRSRAQNGQNMDSRQPSASAAAALDEDALVESFSAVKLGMASQYLYATHTHSQ